MNTPIRTLKNIPLGTLRHIRLSMKNDFQPVNAFGSWYYLSMIRKLTWDSIRSQNQNWFAVYGGLRDQYSDRTYAYTISGT